MDPDQIPEESDWSGAKTFQKEILNTKHYKLCFYDVEVDQRNGEISMWSAAVYDSITDSFDDSFHDVIDNGVYIKIGYTIEQFHDMLSKIECNLLYVMAYNGKRYDHLLMFDGVNYDVCWRQGGYLIKCVYTLGNKTVILKDLCN